jgi:hypothetical protein
VETVIGVTVQVLGVSDVQVKEFRPTLDDAEKVPFSPYATGAEVIVIVWEPGVTEIATALEVAAL